MRKILVALSLVTILAATCFIGCQSGTAGTNDTSDEAVAVFTLDVNPGVRMFVKSDGKVLEVEPTNEDGEQIVEQLEVEGDDYETAVEEVVDEMNEQGFIDGEEGAVLVSIEKKEKAIFDKVCERIEKAFGKHGKNPSVIEQEIDELDEEGDENAEKMAKKHGISKGKAHLIDIIRSEFPELSEEELANLSMNDLSLLLEEATDDVKGEFTKRGKPVEKDYVGKDAALTIALESLELTQDAITNHRVCVKRAEDKMIYMVVFVHESLIYEIMVDAKTGEILSTESKEYVEFDAKEMIDGFCNKHGMTADELKNQDRHGMFGKGEGHHGQGSGECDSSGSGQGDGSGNCEPMLTRGELLKGLMASLEILDTDLVAIDVEKYESESGIVFSVEIELQNGDVYEIALEAYSGTVLSATLNGEAFEIVAE